MKKQKKQNTILRKVISFAMVVCFIVIITSSFVSANGNDSNFDVSKKMEFDMKADYAALIIECSKVKTAESFEQAKEYERLRNQKIEYLGNNTEYSKTSYFTEYTSWEKLFEISFYEKKEDGKLLNNVQDNANKIDKKEDVYFKSDINYAELIEKSLFDPMNNSFKGAKEYEKCRNQKIETMCNSAYSRTYYFTNYNSWKELFESDHMNSYFMKKDVKYFTTDNVNMRSDHDVSSDIVTQLNKGTSVTYLGAIKVNNDVWYKVCKNNTIGWINGNYLADCNSVNYTEEDIYWLAMAITKEMGCEWIPEYARNYVGCVVLNRVDSDLYPNTVYDVLHNGPYQYPWAYKGEYAEPFEWCIETAKDLLINGNRMLPKDILGQSGARQGTYTYAEYYDEILGTTTYFCGDF